MLASGISIIESHLRPSIFYLHRDFRGPGRHARIALGFLPECFLFVRVSLKPSKCS
jgi:hypothetical protein